MSMEAEEVPEHVAEAADVAAKVIAAIIGDRKNNKIYG